MSYSSCFEERKISEPGKDVLSIRLRSYRVRSCQVGLFTNFQKGFFSKRSRGIATQSSHSVDRAGWQAKMASIEVWIPCCNAHMHHWHLPKTVATTITHLCPGWVPLPAVTLPLAGTGACAVSAVLVDTMLCRRAVMEERRREISYEIERTDFSTSRSYSWGALNGRQWDLFGEESRMDVSLGSCWAMLIFQLVCWCWGRAKRPVWMYFPSAKASPPNFLPSFPSTSFPFPSRSLQPFACA